MYFSCLIHLCPSIESPADLLALHYICLVPPRDLQVFLLFKDLFHSISSLWSYLYIHPASVNQSLEVFVFRSRLVSSRSTLLGAAHFSFQDHRQLLCGWTPNPQGSRLCSQNGGCCCVTLSKVAPSASCAILKLFDLCLHCCWGRRV